MKYKYKQGCFTLRCKTSLVQIRNCLPYGTDKYNKTVITSWLLSNRKLLKDFHHQNS